MEGEKQPYRNNWRYARCSEVDPMCNAEQSTVYVLLSNGPMGSVVLEVHHKGMCMNQEKVWGVRGGD
jgi:hypothetical protein